MFTKKPAPERPGFGGDLPRPTIPVSQSLPAASAGSASWSSSAAKVSEKMAPSIIGADLIVMGNVISRGEVHVDGELQGDLHCASLLVGDSATITGGIVAEDVVVRGKVLGSIRGLRVTLQAASHVEGDIYHKSLAIEQGAFFEGKSRRSEDPLAGVSKPEGAALAVSTNGAGPVNLLNQGFTN